MTSLKNLNQLQNSVYTCHVGQSGVWQRHDYGYQATPRLHGSDRLIPAIKLLVSSDLSLYPTSLSSTRSLLAAYPRIGEARTYCSKEVFILIKGNWLSEFLADSIEKYRSGITQRATSRLTGFQAIGSAIISPSSRHSLKQCVLSNDTRRLYTKAATKLVSHECIENLRCTAVYHGTWHTTARTTSLLFSRDKTGCNYNIRREFTSWGYHRLIIRYPEEEIQIQLGENAQLRFTFVYIVWVHRVMYIYIYIYRLLIKTSWNYNDGWEQKSSALAFANRWKTKRWLK